MSKITAIMTDPNIPVWSKASRKTLRHRVLHESWYSPACRICWSVFSGHSVLGETRESIAIGSLIRDTRMCAFLILDKSTLLDYISISPICFQCASYYLRKESTVLRYL